jgi:hypothetical protein
MLEKFNIKQIVFISLMTAFLFVVDFALGSWINSITTIPGMSSFANTITNVFVLTLAILIMRKFGGPTIIYGLYGIIALPTTLAGGAPGFWPKIPLCIISGLLFELPIILFNFKKKGFILSLPLFFIIGYGLYLPVYWLMGAPEFASMAKLFVPGVIVLILLGYVGMWLAFKLYNKIKDKSIIKQIAD